MEMFTQDQKLRTQKSWSEYAQEQIIIIKFEENMPIVVEGTEMGCLRLAYKIGIDGEVRKTNQNTWLYTNMSRKQLKTIYGC